MPPLLREHQNAGRRRRGRIIADDRQTCDCNAAHRGASGRDREKKREQPSPARPRKVTMPTTEPRLLCWMRHGRMDDCSVVSRAILGMMKTRAEAGELPKRE